MLAAVEHRFGQLWPKFDDGMKGQGGVFPKLDFPVESPSLHLPPPILQANGAANLFCIRSAITAVAQLSDSSLPASPRAARYGMIATEGLITGSG